MNYVKSDIGQPRQRSKYVPMGMGWISGWDGCRNKSQQTKSQMMCWLIIIFPHEGRRGWGIIQSNQIITCAKKSKCLKCSWLKFPFFNQLEVRSQRRHIKLKEMVDIDHSKNYLDDRTAHKCNQCKYLSSHRGHLRTHLKTHSGEKPNKCNQCNYASSRAGDLRKHLITHSGERSNKCNQCDFASSQTSDLRRHF